MNGINKLGVAAATGAGLLAMYGMFIRPWHLRWGTTDAEQNEPLPGDEVKPGAGIQVTHAITVNAGTADIWKWLIQIGQGRGGFFSYDWIENAIGLGIHNVNEIRPELQTLKVGDFVRSAHKGWMGGRFDDKAGWFVVRLEPERALVLRDEIDHGSWAFVLKPINESTTRLIARTRGSLPSTVSVTLFNLAIVEPAHFIMERKMLLTLKEKAEQEITISSPDISEGIDEWLVLTYEH